MSVPTNSGRTLLKATYVPLKLSSAASQQSSGGNPPVPSQPPNVLMKVAYLRGLNIRPSKMAKLQASPAVQALQLKARRSAASQTKSSSGALIDVAKEVSTNLSPSTMAAHAPLLAAASP